MLRTCAACGQTNRIPAVHLADSGKCGKCKARLPAQSAPLDVDDQQFSEIVESVKVPVLVDFWASWCPPCRMAAPEVAKLAAAMSGRAVVLKVNTEKHPELAARYHVQGIPNFIVLRNGRLVHQHAGVVRHPEMQRWLENA